MPTAVYDPGTPPPPWEYDPEKLPVYPGATVYKSWRNFITEDSIGKVIAYYKKELPDAAVTESDIDNPITVFTTKDFILEIQTGAGGNTLITFYRPKE
jgi:hypothetical protein